MATDLEFVAVRTQEASDMLARAAKAMPAEKAQWRVDGVGRTAVDMVAECGAMNKYMAAMLNTRQVPPSDHEAELRARQQCDSMEKALSLLEEGTADLMAAIRAFPAAELANTIKLPFGPGMQKSFREVAVMATWNMTYHLGQVNFIQTLYGDKDMH